MIYKRNCPKCGDEIQHKNPRSFKWAKRDGKPCRNCYSKDISATLKLKVESGEWKPHIRNAKIESTQPKNFKRSCTDCGNDISYTSLKGLKKGELANTVCNSCSTYKYNKTFNDVIKEEHIQQMRATKAGFENFEEYKEKYPKKEMYKREVWRYTYKHPLETLEHWDKRGKCGVDGAFQLDHIISINEGWSNKIPAEEIAKWENLRMIPWKDNLLKGG
jgi:hypothetical protein